MKLMDTERFVWMFERVKVALFMFQRYRNGCQITLIIDIITFLYFVNHNDWISIFMINMTDIHTTGSNFHILLKAER